MKRYLPLALAALSACAAPRRLRPAPGSMPCVTMPGVYYETGRGRPRAFALCADPSGELKWALGPEMEP